MDRFIKTENIDETENDPARHTNKRINYCVYFLYKNFPLQEIIFFQGNVKNGNYRLQFSMEC